jgi:alkanesulfonate monooxygenase SsuD/methylene tetrahydromethanopterin reductase-like flavin-dependent oxidoreductase (luciferase family)
MAEATAEKLGWIREAAGERFDALELSITIFVATVTDDRETLASGIAAGLAMEPADILAIPHFLIGTVDQIVDDLRSRREQYGFSYVIVPGEFVEAFTPVVAKLSGT